MTPDQKLIISGHEVKAGKTQQINAQIYRLPTRTSIEIPIIVSRSKVEGPTLLIMGGLHGDEINGIEIVRRLIVTGQNQPEAGTTICIPILNIYGFIQLTREVPDGKDINRSFPGTHNGSLASQIAYFLSKHILDQVDYGLDFHTGGARINNFPQLRLSFDQENALALGQAFGTRFIVNSKFRDKSLRKEASKRGIPLLVFEGGESARLQKKIIDEGVNGITRVMRHLNMVENAPESKYITLTLESSIWVRALASGIHHSIARVGQEVKKGDHLGLITGPFGEYEKPVRSRTAGYIIAINNNPVINRGDALFHIGIQ